MFGQEGFCCFIHQERLSCLLTTHSINAFLSIFPVSATSINGNTTSTSSLIMNLLRSCSWICLQIEDCYARTRIKKAWFHGTIKFSHSQAPGHSYISEDVISSSNGLLLVGDLFIRLFIASVVVAFVYFTRESGEARVGYSINQHFHGPS